MLKEIRAAISIFAFLTLVTGIMYPLFVTGISQWLMPSQSNGSILIRDGKPIGSSLIGQNLSDPKYFWGRPSATSPMPYNGSSSGGSNLGPTNPTQIDAVKARVKTLKDADPDHRLPIPVDLVTASGSGLDPDISPAAALYQISRVAKVRGLDPTKVKQLVEQRIQGRQFGFLGEPRVNVLELNLALDSNH
ncbi:MAG TPA: potassium-transporting ATPase subunit KdpC [Burkholderiales bacterium]|nr:potassium-transporting ATPase subunit KdpC [Burkholderiales bacterium]